MVADGFVVYTGSQSLNKAKTYLEVLDAIATKAIENSGRTLGNLKKTIDTIKNQITSLLSPQLELAGGGKIKMPDLATIQSMKGNQQTGLSGSRHYNSISFLCQMMPYIAL